MCKGCSLSFQLSQSVTFLRRDLHYSVKADNKPEKLRECTPKSPKSCLEANSLRVRNFVRSFLSEDVKRS